MYNHPTKTILSDKSHILTSRQTVIAECYGITVLECYRRFKNVILAPYFRSHQKCFDKMLYQICLQKYFTKNKMIKLEDLSLVFIRSGNLLEKQSINMQLFFFSFLFTIRRFRIYMKRKTKIEKGTCFTVELILNNNFYCNLRKTIFYILKIRDELYKQIRQKETVRNWRIQNKCE